MRTFEKSTKLDNVCYDVRGPVVEEADRMIADGVHILKLNIGNPAPFGLYRAGGSDPGYDEKSAGDRGLFRFQRPLSGPEGHHAVLPAEKNSQCGDR